MSQNDNGYYNARLETELIKKDIVVITNLCEKIDRTIDKLQDISTTLSRMVSIQEQRMDTQEVERIDAVEARILRELAKIRTEIAPDQDEKKSNSLMDRVSSIEKWRYFITGAIFVAGFILARFLDQISILPIDSP